MLSRKSAACMLVRSGIREIKGEPIHVGKKYIASICSEVKVSMAELSPATLRQSVGVSDEPLATRQEHHSSPRQLHRLGAAIDQVRTDPVFELLDVTAESRLGNGRIDDPDRGLSWQLLSGHRAYSSAHSTLCGEVLLRNPARHPLHRLSRISRHYFGDRAVGPMGWSARR